MATSVELIEKIIHESLALEPGIHALKDRDSLAEGDPIPLKEGSFLYKIGEDAPEDLIAETLRKAEAIRIKKGKTNLEKSSWAYPRVSVKDKICILPDTISREDNYGLTATVSYCNLLGYAIRLIPYEGHKFKELSRDQERFAIGLICSAADAEHKINITEKKEVENGRTFARAQQVLHAFSTNQKLGQGALRRNHKWFGNNPKETRFIGKTRVEVEYSAHRLSGIFIEEDWAKYLADLLRILLRQSWKTLRKEVQDHAIEGNLLTPPEILATYCAKPIVVQPATKKKAEIIKNKVPGKPKQSSMLTKEEYAFIMKQFKNLFELPPMMKDHSSLVAFRSGVGGGS